MGVIRGVNPLTNESQHITVNQGPQGVQGIAGSTGPAGVGVPTGGTTGQVLKKASNTNYDTTWDVGGGGGGTWGSITGVLPDQTDLQTALNAKSSTTHAHLLDDLTDVSIASPTPDEVLKYTGSGWVNGAASTIATSAGNVSLTISQTAHGFTVGDVLRNSGIANTYTKARANSAANAEVAGIVTSVADANTFTLTTHGVVTAGVPGNDAGTVMFLDPSTAGVLTATEPSATGQVSKPMAIILEPSVRMLFSNFRGEILTDAPVGGGGTITIEEVDGTPSVLAVNTVKVTNGTLTNNGSGVVTLNTGGSGDVAGPSSAADNALARFDTTTGKLLQNSGVIVDDSNNLSGIGTISSGAITSTGSSSLGPTTLSGLLSFTGTTHAGVTLNSLTTTQRDALSPSFGQMLYNSTLNQIQAYENNIWRSVVGDYQITVGFQDADYICDGTADDVQIQQALDAAQTAGGAEVVLTKGTYDITATVRVPSYVIFRGVGYSTVLLANSSLPFVSNVVENKNKSTSDTHIIVRDLKISGNYSGRTGDDYINNGGTIDEQGQNIMFKNTTHSLMENILSYQSYNSGFCLAQGTTYCMIQNGISLNSGNHGMLLVGDSAGTNKTRKNIIANTMVIDPGSHPNVIAGIGGVCFESAKYAQENIFVGCLAKGGDEGGFQFFLHCTNNIVTGCEAIETSFGVGLISGSDYNTISGCTFRNQTRTGVSATNAYGVGGGRYATIVGNTFQGCAQNAILGSTGDSVAALSGSVINGNTFDTCGLTGTGNNMYTIYLPSATNVVVTGNRFTNGTATGCRAIQMTSNSRWVISGNYIGTYNSHAILSDTGSASDVGNTAGCADTLITNNIIDTIAAGAGIILLKNSARFVISNNVVKSCTGSNSGIDLRGAQDCTVVSNSCIANTGYGIRLANDAKTTPTAAMYNIVSLNTCKLNTLGGVNESGGADFNVYLGNNARGNTANNFVTVGVNNEEGFNITA